MRRRLRQNGIFLSKLPLLKHSTMLWVVLLGSANAQLAGSYESFASQANAGSWLVYDHADSECYVPGWDRAGDGQNPDIFFTFAGTNALEFLADGVASDGAFVGDYVAAGIDAIGCDYYVEDVDALFAAEFFLYSAVEQRYYFSDYITPATNGWSFAYASLSVGPWYVYEQGAYVEAELTPSVLAEITVVGMAFYPQDVPEADGMAVAIDNLTLYGAYVLPQLSTHTADGQIQVSFERQPGLVYSILSSPDLDAWDPVPGEESITGNSNYTMARALTSGSEFFKVSVEDDLQPVPDVEE